jgi:hypothetical protein
MSVSQQSLQQCLLAPAQVCVPANACARLCLLLYLRSVQRIAAKSRKDDTAPAHVDEHDKKEDATPHHACARSADQHELPASARSSRLHAETRSPLEKGATAATGCDAAYREHGMPRAAGKSMCGRRPASASPRTPSRVRPPQACT